MNYDELLQRCLRIVGFSPSNNATLRHIVSSARDRRDGGITTSLIANELAEYIEELRKIVTS